MERTENDAVVDGHHFHRKRRRTLISCTECHRRKQKCDRHRPCQNCVKRCKPALCRYEKSDNKTCNANLATTSGSGIKPTTPHEDSQSLSKTNHLSYHDHEHLVSALGYSTHNVHNTFSLFKKAGATYPSISSHPGPKGVSDRKQTALNDKYRSLVRQLPSKEYIDILVQQFFSEINWHYDVLDEITFTRQLESWRCFPYSAHSQAIGSLPTDLVILPSLVFQLMAHSLIHQPVDERASSSLESLKYAPGMTFVDLAKDFSEAGHSIIEIIEKKHLSLVAVQCGILRASFLKNTGSVIEAWHVVGNTIRNAQEIGLHTCEAVQSPLISVDAQWDYETRRKVWFVLHNWDIHMAVVLGRPITTIMTAEIVDVPDDLVRRQSDKPPRRRMDQDAPTPSSVIRVGYDVAYQYFARVRELENRGARTEDYRSVEEIHAAIVENINQSPRWCRHEDPDVRFDELPDCYWLPAARQSLTCGIHFVLLSLHRPYMFSVFESRTEALKAALMVLIAQRQLFQLSQPEQYLDFNMVYPLFDAIVISLTILILFPNERKDFYCQLIENIYWGIDMLAKIGQYNSMSESANAVLKSLVSRLEDGYGHALQHSNHSSGQSAVESPDSWTADLRAPKTSAYTDFTTDGQVQPTVSEAVDFDVETLLAPHPVGDLFYQDVYEPLLEPLPGDDLPTEFLGFDDNYSNDSFWSFITDLGHT